MDWEAIRECPNYLLAILWEQSQYNEAMQAYMRIVSGGG